MAKLLPMLLAGVLVAFAKPVTPATTIPAMKSAALDGHAVSFPRDLNRRATVLILGFTRGSADATRTWGTPLAKLTLPAGVGVYNMPMLASVPSLVRPMVVRSIRKQVPATLQGTFVPLTNDEARWKDVAEFDEAAPDAAYVLLVDGQGVVHWRTHAAFDEARLRELTEALRGLSR